MSHTRDSVIRQWLKALGGLVAGTLTEAEAAMRLNAYEPLLSQDYGPEHFSGDSLKFVAKSCKFFPSYGEINEGLKAWIEAEANKPRAPRLAAPSDGTAPLTAAEQCMVGFWFEYKSGLKTLPHGVTLKSWLSMCRTHDGVRKAYLHLKRADPDVARIAASAGWHDAPAGYATEDDKTAVGAITSAAFGRSATTHDVIVTGSGKTYPERTSAAVSPTELLRIWEGHAADGVPGAQTRVAALQKQIDGEAATETWEAAEEDRYWTTPGSA